MSAQPRKYRVRPIKGSYGPLKFDNVYFLELKSSFIELKSIFLELKLIFFEIKSIFLELNFIFLYLMSIAKENRL